MWHLQTVVLVFPICLGCAIGAVQTKEPLTNEDPSHALLKDTSENRLYFQGPDYTVNLIPLAILIKIIFVIGYVIKYLLDESSEEIGTYGSTGTGYGASQESVGYNAPSAYEPPAPSYDTHSPSNSYVSPASSYHAPTPTYSAQSSGGTYSRPHRSRVDGVKSVMSSALEKLAELGVSGVVKLSTMLTGEDENGEKEQIKFHDTYGNDITEQVIVLDGQRQGKVEEGPFSNILNRGFESVRRSYLVPESQPQDGLRRRKKNPRPNNEERLSNAPYEFYKSSSASADAQPTPLMNMLPSQSLTPQKQTDPYDKDYYDTEGIWSANQRGLN